MQSASRPETAHRENLAGRLRKRNSARPTTVIEPQRILELGNGLELWKVHPSALREQDVNARSMPKAMFERIAHSIFEGGTPGCQMARRRLECEIAVANEPVGVYCRGFRMPKWKSWIRADMREAIGKEVGDTVAVLLEERIDKHSLRTVRALCKRDHPDSG